MKILPPEFVWISPWAALAEASPPLPEVLGDQTYSQWLAAELQREVCESHRLYRINVEAIGFNRYDPNEFLFLTDDPKTPFAFVHLTWTVETDPRWPWTEGFVSILELTTWMKECHDSYQEDG
jgi:hypothetical protein